LNPAVELILDEFLVRSRREVRNKCDQLFSDVLSDLRFEQLGKLTQNRYRELMVGEENLLILKNVLSRNVPEEIRTLQKMEKECFELEEFLTKGMPTTIPCDKIDFNSLEQLLQFRERLTNAKMKTDVDEALRDTNNNVLIAILKHLESPSFRLRINAPSFLFVFFFVIVFSFPYWPTESNSTIEWVYEYPVSSVTILLLAGLSIGSAIQGKSKDTIIALRSSWHDLPLAHADPTLRDKAYYTKVLRGGAG
jgi:hypothetical protein